MGSFYCHLYNNINKKYNNNNNNNKNRSVILFLLQVVQFYDPWFWITGPR